MDTRKPIKKLDPVVINRIAAGEIIQRPANAVKEMIENCLDAQATNIQIAVKDGGLKLLQIQDNGCGIHKEDLNIVCERFTTSKLQQYEDLESISTYGFRGEALASISHVANLTITSKTRDSFCAYKATYVDGALKGEITPIAGNQGTLIVVEDLFYNMNVRRAALANFSDEYAKLSDVVGKYAVHNHKVGFSLKKQGNSVDIRTAPNSNIVDNIKIVFGNNVAKELIDFEMENDAYKFKVYCQMTNVNYSAKKFAFVLFINHRLVECQSLKRSVDQIYSTYLAKNAHPFVYMSLEIEPRNVDVNVHPTKQSVHFLHEEHIVELISTHLETKLLGSNNTRAFYRQEKLPCVIFESTRIDQNLNNKQVYDKDLVRTSSQEQKLEKFFGPSTSKSKGNKEQDVDKQVEVFRDYILSHNDSLEAKLLEKTMDQSDLRVVPQHAGETFRESEEISGHAEHSKEERSIYFEDGNSPQDELRSGHDTKITKQNEPKTDGETKMETEPITKKEIKTKTETKKIETKKTEIKKTHKTESKTKIKDLPNPKTTIPFQNDKRRNAVHFTSILNLQAKIENNCNYTLREIFVDHVFVGAIDPQLALIQHGTHLILCNTEQILRELFYQCLVFHFKDFDAFELTKPIDLKEVARVALDVAEAGWTEEDGDKDELAERVASMLAERGEMLAEYFAMNIDENGFLHTLPVIIKDYYPCDWALPMYVLRLATEVNWHEEEACFDSFCRETGNYYAKLDGGGAEEGKERKPDWKHTVEHVIYPHIRDYFCPNDDFKTNGALLEVQNLPKLYKVFERC